MSNAGKKQTDLIVLWFIAPLLTDSWMKQSPGALLYITQSSTILRAESIQGCIVTDRLHSP